MDTNVMLIFLDRPVDLFAKEKQKNENCRVL